MIAPAFGSISLSLPILVSAFVKSGRSGGSADNAIQQRSSAAASRKVNVFMITVFKIVRTDVVVAAFIIYRSASITLASTAAVAVDVSIAVGPVSIDRWRPSPSHRSALGAASLMFSNSRSPRAGSGCGHRIGVIQHHGSRCRYDAFGAVRCLGGPADLIIYALILFDITKAVILIAKVELVFRLANGRRSIRDCACVHDRVSAAMNPDRFEVSTGNRSFPSAL